MTGEEMAVVEAIRSAPTPTPVSALIKELVCSQQWDHMSHALFAVSGEERMLLATAFACVQREELRLYREQERTALAMRDILKGL